MAEGPLILTTHCLEVVKPVLEQLADVTERLEICGSIRRKYPMAHDVDVVIEPKRAAIEIPNEFGVPPISPWQARIDTLLKDAAATLKQRGETPDFSQGDRKISFKVQDVPIELYVATPETYECLRLIRTGSKSHNTLLASLAKGRNMKLHADGLGLQDLSTGDFIARTEREILQALLGRYKEPENRE